MSTLKLRRLNVQAHVGAQWVKRWQRAGIDAGMGSPRRRPGYLRFHARGDGADWQGLIVARDWLHLSIAQLQSLLAVECPVASIAGLFRAVPRPLPLEVEALHYRALTDVELVDPKELPAHDVPWLDTPGGRVWLTQLPPARAAHITLGPECWLSDLPLRLELMLGVSHLNPASLIRLKEGDVLRIIQRTHQCWLADRCLGVFTFHEKGIHMQSTMVEANQQDTPDPGIDLGSLSVRLEFVLASQQIDLASLSQIIEGQLIPLADDAAHHIEIRANGKCVARGELVQLDEQLGVELLEVYRNIRNE
ncbi:FliM/FliN family flagellar motor switch protein [Pseudomonas izuensis]|uniref:FliM/FliN family flagellar motor switch protein n=1 Tax=Pseudomonas izuensis TaxID=2684212 RepID=UPI00135A1165|nr:FliM/FliN family flagellar motor switch protein [Pseudomonas izuensis]